MADSKINEPYAVCAHVSRFGEETVISELKNVRESNINWVRTDFDWSGVETQENIWNFQHLDRLIGHAKNAKVNILPILDYDVAWASPAHKNLDKWGAYVDKTVSRYQDYLKYWEVWNEMNYECFWHDTPSPEDYTKLLKYTYEKIKKINPELKVVYGGVAGVPVKFIEGTYQAGATNYFDVMNIHPYYWQGTPENLIKDLHSLKLLMAKYNIANKPIWITETGWSTATMPFLFSRTLPLALKEVGLNSQDTTLTVINDPAKNFEQISEFNYNSDGKFLKNVTSITLDELKNIDIVKHPVIYTGAEESFPAEYIKDLLEYVKNGGTIILGYGLPLYYETTLNSDNLVNKVKVYDRYMKDFHISWEAWWTKQGVPKAESSHQYAKHINQPFNLKLEPTGRFLTTDNLHNGDKFVPIVEGIDGDYKGTIVGVYKLNSNLKGNIIVYTTRTQIETIPEAVQAARLPRTYLIALASGVEKIFWYNFRSGNWGEDAREAHFGIVGENDTAKLAQKAYKTLSELCPTGSTTPKLEVEDNIYTATWITPDGKEVIAIWNPVSSQEIDLKNFDELSKIVTHLGENLTVSENAKLVISSAPIYLVF